MKNDGLPVNAYTDKKWFDLEMKHIFSKVWGFAGLKEDIAAPGDFITKQIGLNNYIIIMGRDRRLRAFHNMCRHKGTRLLQAQGNLKKSITCPYHDWTYDLEGSLIGIPHQEKEFPDLDKSCLGLKVASVDIWRGMIWLHPDENAQSISQWFSSIEDHLGPHQVEDLVELKEQSVSETINANWKIVVENYIDHYHLAQLHSGTLNMYDHSKAEFGFKGKHFAFWEPLEKSYAADLEKYTELPLIKPMPKEMLGVFVPMLFPGVGLSESESSWSVFHIIPISVNETRVEIRIKSMPTSGLSYWLKGSDSQKYWQKRIRPKYNDFDNQHPLGSADFMKEDIYVCEQQQKSFESPNFELGPSAEFGELPIREHQRVVMSYLNLYL
tara:strand:- start:101 stop:1246 length:1146 start_codon:yes stop_codon:yes gene_type:complete